MSIDLFVRTIENRGPYLKKRRPRFSSVLGRRTSSFSDGTIRWTFGRFRDSIIRVGPRISKTLWFFFLVFFGTCFRRRSRTMGGRRAAGPTRCRRGRRAARVRPARNRRGTSARPPEHVHSFVDSFLHRWWLLFFFLSIRFRLCCSQRRSRGKGPGALTSGDARDARRDSLT